METFIEWWFHIESSLREHFRRKGLAADVAEDLIQDVALKMILEADQIGYEKVATERSVAWCKQLANWLLIDRIRIQHRLQQLPDALHVSSPASQEKALLINELLQLVSKLPPQQRFAMEGKLEGRMAKEIAAELGIDADSVRSLQRFARARLASELGA